MCRSASARRRVAQRRRPPSSGFCFITSLVWRLLRRPYQEPAITLLVLDNHSKARPVRIQELCLGAADLLTLCYLEEQSSAIRYSQRRGRTRLQLLRPSQSGRVAVDVECE